MSSKAGDSTPTAAATVAAAALQPTPVLRPNASRKVALLVLAGCLLIWFSRRPEQLFHPYLWDEESLVLRRFMDDGWLGALRPVQGYEILPSSLLLPLAATISFAHLPVLAFWMATAVFALTVWMLVVPESRWGSQSTRALMAFTMALCQANPETFGVLLYSFWWATLWPVIILGWKRDLWWARVPLLVIGGLSSPAGAMLSVLFVVSFWFTRRRADLVGAGVLAVALVFQMTSLMAGGRAGALSTHIPNLLAQSERTIGLFAIWWTSLGRLDFRIESLVGEALLVALGAAVFALWRRQKALEPLLLLMGLVFFTAMSAVPAPLATDPRTFGPRYYFLPFVLLSWVLVYLWRQGSLRSSIPILAVILLAFSALGLSTSFSRSAASTTGRLDWRQELVSCASSSALLVKVPVYSDGSAKGLWWMSMRPTECRARL
jgi:hypothetical protein